MSIILNGTTGVTTPSVTGMTTPLTVAQGGTGVTTSTGSGNTVLSTSSTLTTPTITGASISSMASSVITSGTTQASTSGTSIDFTGIPSWVKRVTVMFSGVSGSGTDSLIVVIGPSGGVETSGYLGGCMMLGNAAAVVVTRSTTSFLVTAGAYLVAASTIHGAMTCTLLDSTTNTWALAGSVMKSDDNTGYVSSGSKALAGALSKLSVKWSGTNTFDAGSINILYE